MTEEQEGPLGTEAKDAILRLLPYLETKEPESLLYRPVIPASVVDAFKAAFPLRSSDGED